MDVRCQMSVRFCAVDYEEKNLLIKIFIIYIFKYIYNKVIFIVNVGGVHIGHFLTDI